MNKKEIHDLKNKRLVSTQQALSMLITAREYLKNDNRPHAMEYLGVGIEFLKEAREINLKLAGEKE